MENKLIKCYCGEMDVCDCDPPLLTKQFTYEEKTNFFHGVLIDLHTYRCEDDAEKVSQVLDAIGGYSYSHMNGNFRDDDKDSFAKAFERLYNKINALRTVQPKL
jgi:hypothetical protein